jgi:hypothetical protein
VVLADKIKTVTDQHLHELIREVRGVARPIPPAKVEGHPPAAIAAAVGQNAGSFTKPFCPADLHSSTPSLTISEHHGDQEDYLWGV